MEPKIRHTGRRRQARTKAGGMILPVACCVASLLFLFSCVSDEQLIGRGTPGPGQVMLEMPMTRSTNDGDPENRIQTIRMIAFTTGSGAQVAVNKLIDNIPADQMVIAFRELVNVGFLDLYLIANERAAWNLEADFPVNGTQHRKQDLKDRVLSFTSPDYPVVDASHPIPMFGAYENIYVDTDETIYAGNKTQVITLGVVERLYAKVTFNLDCVFADMPAGSEPVALRKVSVKTLPTESYLGGKPFAGTFYDGVEIPAGAANYTETRTGANAGFSTLQDAFTFYIPEHKAAGIDNRTYVSIWFGLRDDNTYPDKEFKLYIGDGIAQGRPGHNNTGYMGGTDVTVSDVTVSRNMHYDIKATLKDYSIMTIDFTSKVVRWGTAIDIDLTTGNKGLPANSYILQPDGDPVFLPVSRANAAGAQLTAADEYITRIEWMEKWDGTATVAATLAPASPVRALRPAKTSATDIDKNYIMVTPGSTGGNAVISLRKASDPTTILWSWHIWVTHDKEAVEAGAGTENAWMDRPLGALPDGHGLYYQWGRRSPYSALQPVTATGAPVGAWGATKTKDDPCPPGWRVPTRAEYEAEIASGDVTGFAWDATDPGRQKAPAGGFYPASGWMTAPPAVVQKNSGGKYWHSTSAGVLSFTASAVTYPAEPAANACSVRCIREE